HSDVLGGGGVILKKIGRAVENVDEVGRKLGRCPQSGQTGEVRRVGGNAGSTRILIRRRPGGSDAVHLRALRRYGGPDRRQLEPNWQLAPTTQPNPRGRLARPMPVRRSSDIRAM